MGSTVPYLSIDAITRVIIRHKEFRSNTGREITLDTSLLASYKSRHIGEVDEGGKWMRRLECR